MPPWFKAPNLQRYYRAVDTVADTKEATEAHLYARLTDLANLDLRLVCYDLTSTYFEGSTRASERLVSKAFGYSRDRRRDRPHIVIGLLCTGDGTPIAHHVFAGNTTDVSTLPGVLEDLAARFGVGRICVVADRGLISVDNVEVVATQGFDHVLATRLHSDLQCRDRRRLINAICDGDEPPGIAAAIIVALCYRSPAGLDRPLAKGPQMFAELRAVATGSENCPMQVTMRSAPRSGSSTFAGCSLSPGLLPARHHQLALFDRWCQQLSTTIDNSAQRQTITANATWPRLRASSP